MAWCGRSASGKMGEKIPLNKNKYMKNQTKWLIGVVVVAALGSLAYLGTSTDLFKGSLRGEKSGLPAVTEAQCKMIMQKKFNQGYLEYSEQKYYASCRNSYPSLFPFVNINICQDVKKLIDGGNLAKDQNLGSKAYKCEKDFPSVWYGFASPQSCKAIK